MQGSLEREKIVGRAAQEDDVTDRRQGGIDRIERRHVTSGREELYP